MMVGAVNNDQLSIYMMRGWQFHLYKNEVSTITCTYTKKCSLLRKLKQELNNKFRNLELKIYSARKIALFDKKMRKSSNIFIWDL